jgi:hypothetical protein
VALRHQLSLVLPLSNVTPINVWLDVMCQFGEVLKWTETQFKRSLANVRFRLRLTHWQVFGPSETFVDNEAAVIAAHFSFLKQRGHWQPPGLVNKSCV